LTALQVKAYADDPNQTKPLHDGGGLYLRKRDSSSRWYLRMTEPGTGAEQWHQVFPDDPAGGYPGKSLAQARIEADRLRATRSAGLDPRAERQRLASERRKRREEEAAAEREQQLRLSVRQLFDLWVSTQLQPRIRADGRRTGRKDGGKFVRDQFERHVFPMIGSKSAADLRKADLLAVLDAQTSAGKMRTANVLLADLKQMCDFAADRELIASNPLSNTKKAKIGGASVERSRALSDEELNQLAQALPLARMQPRSAIAIWLILATGTRVGELMGAVWSDALPSPGPAHQSRLNALQAVAVADEVKLGIVDLAARTWYLPDTKNQRDHTIHLSEFAVAQFRMLAALRTQLKDSQDGTLSPWVFPAADNRRPVCVKSFGKQLADRQRTPEQRMSNRTKATTSLQLSGGRWTAHDLRRTAATLMARLGFGSDTINECLNHMQSDRMARVYIQDRREDDQRRAFDALGARLQSLSLTALR
jgi:integrase